MSPTLDLRAILVIVCTAAFLATGCGQKSPAEPIWIGSVASLTGADKAAGEHARHGITLAVDEANQEDNLVLGRKVAVRHADAGTSGEAAQSQAERLVSLNHVIALLGGTDSAQAERLARAVQSSSVPLLVQSGLARVSLNESTFSCAGSPARRGQVLGEYALKEAKWSRPLVLADSRNPAFTVVADAFAKVFPSDTVTRLDYKTPEELADLADRFGKARPQTVLFAGVPRDLARVGSELRKAGLTLPLLFAGDPGTLSQAASDAGTDLYLATPWIRDAAGTLNLDFVKKYEARFTEAPDVNAALAYDGARLLFEAIRKAQAGNAAKVREELPKVEGFESLTGPLTLGKDHNARRKLFVVRLKAGRSELVKEYPPTNP
jgi:branched-chain amino acid transport system substrate-binding protein